MTDGPTMNKNILNARASEKAPPQKTSLQKTSPQEKKSLRKVLLNACAFAVSAALVSGCSLIPDYERPASPVPAAWPQGPGYAATAAGTAAGPLWTDTAWKTFFVDPGLQGLIERALSDNRDLRAAALAVQQARAAYRVTEADRLPTVDGSGSETLARAPGSLSRTGQAETTRTYTAQLGVTAFEIDLFGRVGSLNQKALEQFLATEEARSATQISLIAEVAGAYLTLLGDRKLLALTEETLRSRERSLNLIRQSFQRGVGSELDVAQALSSVETARAARHRYQRAVEQDKNALALLIGGPLDVDGPVADLDRLRLVEDLPPGVPSDVLLRRPDVAQAEHALKAANADIGAARAAFFPKISLTAAFGSAGAALTDLFAAGSGAWSFAPAVSLPIFDGGRNQANLESAEAERSIAVARYEKAIQTAFREAADGLAAKGALNDQLKAQTALVAAGRTSLNLSQARYDRGIDSYLNVLDSQRSLYAAQQEQVAIQVARLTNLVALYKALGGGRS